jgi:aminoglycoside/choline kinase family phosphotransferase
MTGMDDTLRELTRAAINLSRRMDEGALGDGTAATMLTRGGSDRYFLRLTDGVRSVIALIEPGGGEEFERYIAIGRFLERHGVGVPTVHTFDRASGVLLMEDLGDTHLEDDLAGCTPAEELSRYRSCLDVLVSLQTTVTVTMVTEGFLAQKRFDRETLLGETEYFEREFIEGYAGMSCPPGWKDECRLLAARLAGEPAVFMHRDFQSRNIMIKEGRIRIVDFQTAHRGPGLYDAASLLKDPYHPLPAAARHRLLQEYHGNLRAAGGTVPASYDDLFETFVLAGIQRNCQALAAYAFLGRMKGKEQFLHSIPAALNLVEEGTEENGGFPILRSIVNEVRNRIAKGLL